MIAPPASPLRVVVALFIALLLLSSPALAQDDPDQPMPAPPADPSVNPPPPQPAPAQPAPAQPVPGYAPYGHGGVVALTDRDLKRLLNDDPVYRAGKGRRLGGILVTTIGGGLSAVFAAAFGFTAAVCSDIGSSSSRSCSELRNVAVGFLIGFGVSLAVGIPLWVSGQSQMNEVKRARFQEVVPVRPQVSLDLGPKHAGLGLGWRFW